MQRQVPFFPVCMSVCIYVFPQEVKGLFRILKFECFSLNNGALTFFYNSTYIYINYKNNI